MQICHINLASAYRGGERQTELLTRELSKRGWSQRLVVRNGQPLAAKCRDIERLEIVSGSSNLISAGRAAKGAALVHAHEARAVYAGFFANLLYGIPMVLTRRVTREQKKSWIRGRAYRGATSVVAVSDAVSMHIRDTYPDLQPVVIPDALARFGVDTDVVGSLREKYAHKVLIGHVGSYDQSAKGQLTIIEAARQAAAERPDWHFLLLGAGKDEAFFREQIGELRNIELVGFRENVGDYLAAFDVFVFPSLHEALGSSVLDAMSFGLPVVASRVGGIPELIEDGINGFLINPHAPADMTAAIAKIVDDRDLAAAMHLANRARADDFSAGAMAERYEALYRSAL